jgi:hypothetical protein
MSARYGGLSGSFSETLRQFADQTKDSMDEIFRSVVIQLSSSVVRLSPVDTGAFRGSWTFTIDAPSTEAPTTLDKGGHETIAKILSGVQHLTFGQTAYLVSNLPYSIPLEYGHSSKAPAGMVAITLELFQQIVNEAVREVTA